MKLILSSCDFGNPTSARFITDHLNKPISECRVLFFPNEKATPEKIKSGIYQSRLSKFGFRKKHIFVADYFNSASPLPPDVDVVYISGGNTFGTMKRIRESGLDRAILHYVQHGAVYIGGSAGAHIASANFAHVARYDGDTYGLEETSGLGLYQGILICHTDEGRRRDADALALATVYPVRVLENDESLLVKED